MMMTSQPEGVAASRTNPGETLRLARESKGWSVTQVAAQLNLTEHSLRQLEQGNFDQLPGHTFARGYVRAYAKLLGMDQAQLVSTFDQYTGTDASGSTVHSLGRVAEPVRLSRNLLRLFSLLLLALLIAFAYFWWQERNGRAVEVNGLTMEHVEVESADGTTEIHTLDEPEDQAVAEDQANTLPLSSASEGAADQPSEQAAAPAPADPLTAPASTAAAPVPIAPATPAAPVAPAAPAATVPAVPAPAPEAPATEQAIAPAAPAQQPASSAAPVVAEAGQGVVKIDFVADCWTQITDADGKVLVSALKRKGNALEIAGKAPMELRLGFARGAQVSYNGQPVTVQASRGETARLKLGGQ
ncbi:helix-turn-helix domain-containing protein [Pseudomonas schmalbachii]|uniref:Helix-turn-helix domain-containing protein n=1 Tax=Pseudomonas schmalbachii TaxID=2816993 RepID=A0ABS3TMP1_9PSED|nr:RodZ family helix-turn-helix domain-containing protein [Pseudomonas schmalbachii]MBO3274923.1 helix-turn-helix domain-containing protein [Pseudomonas schmalbachii]